MPKIEWMVLKADELHQLVEQTSHANCGALKQRKYSFSSGTRISWTLMHRMQITARQQWVSTWKGSLLLGAFSGFLDATALTIPSPFWSFWKNKCAEAPALTLTEPQKAAVAKGWNILADAFFFLFKGNKERTLIPLWTTLSTHQEPRAFARLKSQYRALFKFVGLFNVHHTLDPNSASDFYQSIFFPF